MARKMTAKEARDTAASRKHVVGGRPLKPRCCPRCGAPCASATQAAAHCVGRNAPLAVWPVAVLTQVSESVRRYLEYPRWKYHPTKAPVRVNDAQGEAALGEGWSDRPIQSV